MSAASLEAELRALLGEDPADIARRERSAFDSLLAPFEGAVVLFGSGNLGRRALAILRRGGVEPRAFADNNRAAWGTTVEGVPVLSPGEAAQRFGSSALFVITIWNPWHHHAATCRQLRALGCVAPTPFASLIWKAPDRPLPDFFFDLPHTLPPHTEEIVATSALWADEASRREYLAQLRWRMLQDFEGLPPASTSDLYFRDDLFLLDSEELLVDCGAYDGDTLRTFLRRRGQQFRGVIALEPDPKTFRKLSACVAGLPEEVRGRVAIHELAVGARREKLRFAGDGTMGSAVGATGGVEVQSVALDELLAGAAPTTIIMDIEGAELSALEGARRTIAAHAPVLAVCLYHRPEDLWRIPAFIRTLSQEYELFLRADQEEGWQLICYAVPKGRRRAAAGRS